MVKVIPCKYEHVEELLSLPYNQSLGFVLKPSQKSHIENDLCKTILVNGDVAFVGGVVQYWENRAEAWAIFRPGLREHFIALHKEVKSYFRSCPFLRIEATVECEFENGHRWIRALGFTLEAPRLKSYFPDGKDASLYALIK